MTSMATTRGWLSLAVVLDVYSRLGVGWSLSENNDEELVENALRMALLRRRPKPGLVHHSDRGSQDTSRAYRRLAETGDDARRDFHLAVRKHADSIAEKYILPDEHTYDYALMFVPSEAVYYELLMTQDSKYGQLDEYCRNRRVFPVSPNTFYACLNAVAVSLQGQKIEENARHLMAGLAGLNKQFESFAEVYERLGTHLRHAQQSYEDADSRLSRARNSLEQMSQGALPEVLPRVFESASKQ